MKIIFWKFVKIIQKCWSQMGLQRIELFVEHSVWKINRSGISIQFGVDATALSSWKSSRMQQSKVWQLQKLSAFKKSILVIFPNEVWIQSRRQSSLEHQFGLVPIYHQTTFQCLAACYAEQTALDIVLEELVARETRLWIILSGTLVKKWTCLFPNTCVRLQLAPENF